MCKFSSKYGGGGVPFQISFFLGDLTRNDPTCNSNFEKSLLSDMHHPTPNICVKFETNRLVSYTAPHSKVFFYERQTDIASDNIRYFFSKRKKLLKIDSFRHASS